jgi:tetratricopeptide (TPR) repeat protein
MLAVISTFSIGWIVAMLPGGLYGRGGPGLLGQGVPVQTAAPEYGGGFNRGETGGVVSSAAVFAYVPAAPASPRWSARLSTRETSAREASGKLVGWGYQIGPAYWGFRESWWYGGFPFSYATFDYANYRNPYYDANPYEFGFGAFDYSIPLAQQADAKTAENELFFAAARAAFYAGNGRQALRDIEHAAIDVPGNLDLHEFHALVLFALGDYRAAGAVVHPVLNAGPGWDWRVLQSFYPSTDVYTRQLRALEHDVGRHGDQAAARFLLAYHYLMLKHWNAARNQLERVAELEPRDALTKNILAGLNAAPSVDPSTPRIARPIMVERPPGNSANALTARSDSTPATVNLTATYGDSLVGGWTSHPIAGVTIEATLEPQGHFLWLFKDGSQTQTFSGTYVRQGDRLVFTRQDGRKMAGVVTPRGKNGFSFRLSKTDPSDPGLAFSK